MSEGAPRGTADRALDALVAAAYEAGAGSRPWEDVCRAMMDAFGLWGVQILGVFKANGSPMFKRPCTKATPWACPVSTTPMVRSCSRMAPAGHASAQPPQP